MSQFQLLVREDLPKGEWKNGDHFYSGIFGLKTNIIDLNYKTKYGEFVAVEIDEDAFDAIFEGLEPVQDVIKKLPDQTTSIQKPKDTTIRGCEIDSSNPIEIVGTIEIANHNVTTTGLGLFVKFIKTNEIIGMSMSEVMELIFDQGATNAMVLRRKNGVLHSNTIHVADGLPSFDSRYWRKDVYGDAKRDFAPLTAEASARVQDCMQRLMKFRNKRAIEKERKEE